MTPGPRPWDILEFNECRHCFGVLELRAGIGWLHTQSPKLETTCERIAPARASCPMCGASTYVRPNGAPALHSPRPGFLCNGLGLPAAPPTPESAAFTPYG